MSGKKKIKEATRYLLLMVAMGLSQIGLAGEVSFLIKDKKGETASNAVITLRPLFEADWSNMAPGVGVMNQRRAMFRPFVLAVRANTPISFPNLDQFRHQVYSFSKAKRFELRLYGKDESKNITFDNTGVVSLGCNIHDNMLAYIYVTDHPYFTETNAKGEAILSDVREGEYELTVWHPDQKKRKVSYKTNITVLKEDSTHEIAIKMRSIRRMQKAADPAGYLG